MTPGNGKDHPVSPMLAAACLDGKVVTGFLQSTVDSSLLLAANGMILTVRTLDGYCHVDDAYNMLLWFFLQSECTHVVTVGSDQGWRAEDLLRLINFGMKYDVVAGIFPKKADPPEWNVLFDQDELWANEDGLIECATIGTGFMCLSRNAVQKLADDAETYDFPTTRNGERFVMENIPMILERRIIGRQRYGGDNVLCIKWRELGGKVFADPYGHFTHTGTKTYSGCAAEWYKARIECSKEAPAPKKPKRQRVEEQDTGWRKALGDI